MLVLIDYDNVPENDRRQGPDHVVRKLLSLLPNELLAGRTRVRLYGGWYEASKLTRIAQHLGAKLRAESPVRIPQSDGSASLPLADVELAVSTLSHPRTYVDNSYREQSLRSGIKCESRPWLICAHEVACPMKNLNAFFENEECVLDACAVSPRDVLKRKEQKVVDTMMVVDLATAHEHGYPNLCVVSRDDDIWPGLCAASLKASSLIHVTTASSLRMPKYYRAIATPPYQLIQWD